MGPSWSPEMAPIATSSWPTRRATTVLPVPGFPKNLGRSAAARAGLGGGGVWGVGWGGGGEWGGTVITYLSGLNTQVEKAGSDGLCLKAATTICVNEMNVSFYSRAPQNGGVLPVLTVKTQGCPRKRRLKCFSDTPMVGLAEWGLFKNKLHRAAKSELCWQGKPDEARCPTKKARFQQKWTAASPQEESSLTKPSCMRP